MALQNLVPEMIRIEAGAFWMGALDWNKVYLDEYWISKYPVTEGQFTRLFEQFGNTRSKKTKPPV
jgi:formylglycine-generating enzyme required for sulfatase activity